MDIELIKDIELPKIFTCNNCGKLPIFKFTKGNVLYKLSKKSYSCYCKKCTRQYNKEWRIKNYEKKQKQDVEYYQLNKEKIKESKREYYKNNKDGKVLEYKTENKEQIEETKGEWRNNNKEYIKKYNKQWQKDNGLQLKNKNIWNGTDNQYNLDDFLNKSQIVYFIGDIHKQYIKIGITTSIFTISHRFRVIQGCNPTQLKLYGFIQTDNNRKLEKQLHQQFSQYHKVAEWFYYVPEIVKYVETNCMKIELANTIFGETYLSLEEIY